VDEGTARGEAARRVSRETGVPRRALYLAAAAGGDDDAPSALPEGPLDP
jgi:hypothetical protein